MEHCWLIAVFVFNQFSLSRFLVQFKWERPLLLNGSDSLFFIGIFFKNRL
uniref:Uncharacterized protein n=1 Tax=Anguilla anguilla TaxID=7936 RepID=A0A0E9TWE1_ANGAN